MMSLNPWFQLQASVSAASERVVFHVDGFSIRENGRTRCIRTLLSIRGDVDRGAWPSCKQFSGPSDGRRLRGGATVQIIVVTMQTTLTISILANVVCYNSVTR
jgi:hypothetical protein